MISLTYWQLALILYAFGGTIVSVVIGLMLIEDQHLAEITIMDIGVLLFWSVIWPYYIWCSGTD